MKKKNLKNLTLHTRKISDLTLLHKNIGGSPNTDIITQPTIRTNDLTIVRVCQTKYESCNFTDCVTNSATIKAPPPSEYVGCNQSGVQ